MSPSFALPIGGDTGLGRYVRQRAQVRSGRLYKLVERDPINQAASEVLGLAYLYPYQRLVVANTLDALEEAAADHRRPLLRQMVILPTGSGKSACFQLPAVMAKGITVVVYPLLGLMADQARRLSERGIGAVSLQGGMEPQARAEAFARLRDGSARIALCNPEILAAEPVLSELRKLKPDSLVVDEAHCVSEWGDSFRPAYLKLGELATALDPACITAFTATASPAVLQRVADILFGKSAYELVSASADRPSIRYEVQPALSMNRALRQAMAELPRPMVVFIASRDGAAMAARYLRLSACASDARFYHAGLTKPERSAIESWFLASPDGVLTATCAYGLGMDKKNIRSVVHLGLPASIEAFLQESGRAGRDGKQAYSRVIVPWMARPPLEPRKLAMHDWAYNLARGRAEGLSEGQDLGSPIACRRARLLGLIGQADAEATPCQGEDGSAGCDLCDGTASDVPAGLDTIRDTLRTQPWRFTLPALAAFLGGRGIGYHQPAFGALADWEDSERKEALSRCLKAGVARRGRFLRKNHLAPARTARYASGNSSSCSCASSSSSEAGAETGFLGRGFGRKLAKERRWRGTPGCRRESSRAQGLAT